jgi:mRNA-degrading endonuclease toxin of MazEF toxin-antitoxin module
MVTNVKDKIDNACDNFKKVINSNNPKFNKLDNWLEKESNIFVQEIQPSYTKKYYKYQQGQILKIDFGVNIGSELSHTHFGIVLNSDDNIKADNITVLPISSKKGYGRIPLGNILSDMYSKNSKYQNCQSYALLTQIKTVSKQRILLNNKISVCDKSTMNRLNKILHKYFKLYRS